MTTSIKRHNLSPASRRTDEAGRYKSTENAGTETAGHEAMA